MDYFVSKSAIKPLYLLRFYTSVVSNICFLCKGASINYVDKQGERGLAKCQPYYITLCNKIVNEGGMGVKNPQNSVNVIYGCPIENLCAKT